MPRRDGNGSELFTRRAVLMHVPGSSQGIRARRQKRLEGRFVGIVLARRRLSAADSALRAAVRDHGNVAQAELQGGRRMGDMHFEGRAADDGRVDERRPNSEIFGERKRRHADLRGRREQPINCIESEAAVGERAHRALRHQIDRAEAVGDLAQVGFGDADDGGRAALQRSHHASSAGSKTG